MNRQKAQLLAESLKTLIKELEKQKATNSLLHEQLERSALCSDHRDKFHGKQCRQCVVEKLVDALGFYGDAEKLAERLHTTYETFAPSVGYKTRIESRVAWQAVPDANKKLMIKVAESIGEKARAAIEANGGE